ncbi:MAG TPA: alpha/beta hydrolase [Steroidobacteraceae bacterium]|nr:alpha/beta hydrolase [Steroidobacteraceae bacterium]
MSTPQPVQDRFLDRAGARLRWRLAGSGPELVLLHGWALDLDYWDPVVALLAPRFTVLRFDRRGFGLSTGTPDIHRNVDDLLAILAAAGVRFPVLVGMSQGARLALHFACREPARTRALVLDGAPAFDVESGLPLLEYAQRLAADGPRALQAAILRHPLMELRTGDAAAHELLAAILTRYRGLDLLHPLAHARAPQTGSIAAPVLILNGGRDEPTRRAAGATLQRQMPHAQRLTLPGAGHLAALDNPARYAQAVADFCDSLPLAL